MTKLLQCRETARQGSTYMGGGAKITVDVDAQVVDNTDWFDSSTSDRDKVVTADEPTRNLRVVAPIILHICYIISIL